jgi:hypothetical protein
LIYLRAGLGHKNWSLWVIIYLADGQQMIANQSKTQ